MKVRERFQHKASYANSSLFSLHGGVGQHLSQSLRILQPFSPAIVFSPTAFADVAYDRPGARRFRALAFIEML